MPQIPESPPVALVSIDLPNLRSLAAAEPLDMPAPEGAPPPPHAVVRLAPGAAQPIRRMLAPSADSLASMSS